MNVRVIIVSDYVEGFHVSVLTSNSERSWKKKYISRHACLNGLFSAGILTHPETAEARASNLGNKDRIFEVHTQVESEVLSAAGFVERKKDYVH
jgi:hypothetical protein